MSKEVPLYATGIEEIDATRPDYITHGEIVNQLELAMAEAEETVAQTESQHEMYWALVAAYDIIAHDTSLRGFAFVQGAGVEGRS